MDHPQVQVWQILVKSYQNLPLHHADRGYYISDNSTIFIINCGVVGFYMTYDYTSFICLLMLECVLLNVANNYHLCHLHLHHTLILFMEGKERGFQAVVISNSHSQTHEGGKQQSERDMLGEGGGKRKSLHKLSHVFISSVAKLKLR